MAKMPLGYSSDKLLGMLDEAKRKSRQPGVYNIDRDQVMSFGLSPQRVGMEIVKHHPEMGVQVLGEDLKVVDSGIDSEEHRKVLSHPQNNISPGVSYYPRGEGKPGGIRPDRYSGLYRGMTESVHPKHYGFGHTESQISSADEVNDDASAGSFVTAATKQEVKHSKDASVKPNESQSLTQAQYDKILEMIEYEKTHTTLETAKKYNNTWGTSPMGQSDFADKPIPSTLGMIDLDWYTTLVAAYEGSFANPVMVLPGYVAGKLIWNAKRGIKSGDPESPEKWVPPFKDPKERKAVLAIIGGMKLKDLFPVDFMEDHKPLESHDSSYSTKQKE